MLREPLHGHNVVVVFWSVEVVEGSQKRSGLINRVPFEFVFGRNHVKLLENAIFDDGAAGGGRESVGRRTESDLDVGQGGAAVE